MELEERELEDVSIWHLAAEILSFYKSGNFEDVLTLKDERIRHLATEILSFDNLDNSEDGNDSELLDGHEALCDFSLLEGEEESMESIHDVVDKTFEMQRNIDVLLAKM